MSRTLNIEPKLVALRSFIKDYRRMPGYEEMLHIFQYRSKSAVHRLMGKLVERGELVRDSGGKLVPSGTLIGGVRLLGTVQAGFPSPAEEELIETLSLDEFLVERPDATYMLTVSGDSMIDAGIHPGDIVLVEKGREPRNNDIVIAQVDGEWTMKYYARHEGIVRLEAANAHYAPIVPRSQLVIGGIVRSVIRKYS